MITLNPKVIKSLVAISDMARMATDGDGAMSYKSWVKLFSPAKTPEELEKIDRANKKLIPAKPKGKRQSPSWSAYIEAYNDTMRKIMKPIWAARAELANKAAVKVAKIAQRNLKELSGLKVTVSAEAIKSSDEINGHIPILTYSSKIKAMHVIMSFNITGYPKTKYKAGCKEHKQVINAIKEAIDEAGYELVSGVKYGQRAGKFVSPKKYWHNSSPDTIGINGASANTVEIPSK